MKFDKEQYGYAHQENSREDFRKRAIHNFRNAALIEDNGEATNSPNYSLSYYGGDTCINSELRYGKLGKQTRTIQRKLSDSD